MRNKFVKLFSFFLLFPIRVWIAIINTFRGSGKSGDKFIGEFRSKIQNDFSKIIEHSYKVRSSVKSNVKLTYADIGARGGLLTLVSKNLEHFDKIILCEGEPEEAKKLRDQGYLVIDKFLADKTGAAKFFYIPGHPGASSLKRPGTPFLHLFSATHYKTYTEKYTESDITTSTLDIELEKLNVKEIDFLKLDVQGSELSIIKGLTTLSPLFWEVEVLSLPTYQDTPYGSSITAELVNRGYICFRQSGRMVRDGIYIYSNEMYMPDYTTEFGRNLILKNFDKWKLMMELFDVNALAVHIEQIINESK